MGILLGHLTVSHEGNWGQVQVQGMLSRPRTFPSEVAARAFLRSHSAGFIEELWDVARRALNVNAALMDCDFDLPVRAPHADVTLTEPAIVSQPQLMEDEG